MTNDYPCFDIRNKTDLYDKNKCHYYTKHTQCSNNVSMRSDKDYPYCLRHLKTKRVSDFLQKKQDGEKQQKRQKQNVMDRRKLSILYHTKEYHKDNLTDILSSFGVFDILCDVILDYLPSNDKNINVRVNVAKCIETHNGYCSDPNNVVRNIYSSDEVVNVRQDLLLYNDAGNPELSQFFFLNVKWKCGYNPYYEKYYSDGSGYCGCSSHSLVMDALETDDEDYTIMSDYNYETSELRMV